MVVGIVDPHHYNYAFRGNYMMLRSLSTFAILLIMITSLVILLSNNWRLILFSFSVQFLAVFILISLVWPIGLAAIKLVIGFLAVGVLGTTQVSREIFPITLETNFSHRMFKAISAILIWIFVYYFSNQVMGLINTSQLLIRGSLVLLSMGILQIGISTHPARVIIGLFTFLSGFEILYASMESSVLVAGLLALVNLGLAIVGSYILSKKFEVQPE